MLKPKALKKGDTIGILSPASPIEAKQQASFENGIYLLKNLGYNVKLGKNSLKSSGYLAGSDKERACDLMEMFQDKNINAIICSRGGYGTERLLSYLDFNIISHNPKIFAGYSNISFLLNIFTQYCGFVTFHSPMIINIGESPTGYNTNNLIETVSLYKRSFILGTQSEGRPPDTPASKADGILIGGNLTTILGTIGTKYEINTKDCILFLEEVNEEAYAIDRMLTFLKNIGKLDVCKGFILGDFTDCSESSGKTVSDVIEDIILPMNKPVILSFKSGHGKVKPTLPFGANVEIDVQTGTVHVLEPVIAL
ncbi:MAG: S66 peptidase family protein [Deltaproteobacteria bacterium]